MSPETTKLVAHAEMLLGAGFSSASSRDPNCIALLNCVQDKGNAGRLSLLPTGLCFESEGGLLHVPMHDVLHITLQEANHSDVDVPLQIPKGSRYVVSNIELLRLQRLLVECRDSTRLMGGSANLSGAPEVPSAAALAAAADDPLVDDTFQQLQKRVVVVQRLVLDGAAHNNMVPMLSELRFVAANPNDALEFSVIACSRISDRWAQLLLPDVRKAGGVGGEGIALIAPVVSLNHVQSGFFGGKSSDDLVVELCLVNICSNGIAVASVVAAPKAEHGYALEKWRFVDYSKISDISLSIDDPLQFSFAFAKGCAWDPVAIYTSCPTLRWQICCAVQRLYCSFCAGKHLARNLFAERFYPASWAEVRALSQSSAELWLSRSGLPCLKFGRQGEPQVRIIKLNVLDSTLTWNSSAKKKDPLYLAQVRVEFKFARASRAIHCVPGAKF
jgi:hypothetical protein